MPRKKIAGFTLVELMVSITIMGILAAIVTANFTNSRARTRDLERQSDLRELQSAIENYKRDNGRYPEMGCGITQSTAGDGFSSEGECDEYIEDLAPKYIIRLPKDPNRDAGEQGYSYVTNTNGTVYKIMAMNTVESESVNYSHPFKSCDIRPTGVDSYPGGTNPALGGWCFYVRYNLPRVGGYVDGESRAQLNDCRQTKNGGNGRFNKSYGMWGGFEPYTPITADGTSRDHVANTAIVICE